MLEDGPEPRAGDHLIEPADLSTSHDEQPVVAKERVEARPRRSRASAATIRRRRVVAIAAVGAFALLIAGVAGARSVFAPSLEATGPADGTHVDAAGLNLEPDYLLSNSFGFGGINAALLFRRVE